MPRGERRDKEAQQIKHADRKTDRELKDVLRNIDSDDPNPAEKSGVTPKKEK